MKPATMNSSTRFLFQALGSIISMVVVIFLTAPLMALWTGHMDLIYSTNVPELVFGCWVTVSAITIFGLPYAIIGILVNNYFTYDDKTRSNASFIGAIWVFAVPWLVITYVVNLILPPAQVTPR
jgi:hypothetical protein